MRSVALHYSAEELAHRLTLAEPERFNDEGALVVLFPLGDLEANVPIESGNQVEETEGGARQWVTTANVEFPDEQLLFFVLPTSFLSRDAVDEVLTADQANIRARWEFQSPRLMDSAYREEILLDFRDRLNQGAELPASRSDVDDLLDNL